MCVGVVNGRKFLSTGFLLCISELTVKIINELLIYMKLQSQASFGRVC